MTHLLRAVKILGKKKMLGGLREPEKGISELLLPLQRVQCLMELCLSLSFATELLLELSEAGLWSRFCKSSSSCTRLCQTPALGSVRPLHPSANIAASSLTALHYLLLPMPPAMLSGEAALGAQLRDAAR